MGTQRKFTSMIRQCSAAAVILAFSAVGTALAGESLTLTAGSPGGGYFKAAAAFAEYIKNDIPGTSTSVIPGGGWANNDRLHGGQADVAVLSRVQRRR